MKTCTVTAGSRENPIAVTAQINNANEADELTPALARSASRIAFGHTSSTVTDGSKTYRLNGSAARLVAHETAGRPRFDPAAPTVRTTVRLTNAQVAKAEQLGGGNVAQGVRNAIEAADGGKESTLFTSTTKQIVSSGVFSKHTRYVPAVRDGQGTYWDRGDGVVVFEQAGPPYGIVGLLRDNAKVKAVLEALAV